jgi:hypothetical protein
MKRRVKSTDGVELSTVCRQLKLTATDGKQRLTDVATAEIMLRIVQSIPSPKQATGLSQNKKVAQTGGSIAKQARLQLEQQTRRSVVTGDNYLPPTARPKAVAAKKSTK